MAKVGFKTFLSGENTHPKSAIIFIPGWGYTERSKTVAYLCNKLSEKFTGMKIYAIKAQCKEPSLNSFEHEAKAIANFLTRINLKSIILIGHSFGGSITIHLVKLITEQNSSLIINSLILIDSSSLYKQSVIGFVFNFIRDIAKPRSNNSSNEIGEGFNQMLTDIKRLGFSYPKQLLNEIIQATNVNKDIPHLQIPVLLIQGREDEIFNYKEVPPNIFKYSSRSSMVLEEGHHGFLTEKPEIISNLIKSFSSIN